MYFLSVPIAALSIIAYLWFREPRLHKTEDDTSLRSHLAVTYRTLTERGRLLPIIGLAVLTSLALQVVFVRSAVARRLGDASRAVWTVLGRADLDVRTRWLTRRKVQLNRLVPLGITVVLMILASLVLTRETGVAVVTIAQVVLALLIVLASIHVTRLLHDAVSSTVRSGVASGVGALSWIAFLPSALVFGIVSKQTGVHTASWMIVAATVGVGIVLVAMALRRRREPVSEEPEVILKARSNDRGHAWNLRGSGDLVSDLTCVEFVELVTAFLDGAFDPITERRLVDHLPNCVGCERYFDQFRQTIETLRDLPPQSLTSKDGDALLAPFRDLPSEP